jgi:hypothetical protein
MDTRDDGTPADPPTTREVRLYERAIAERWEIPPAARLAAVRRLLMVLANPESSTRAVVAAVNALSGLSRINLAAVDVAARAKTVDDLAAEIAAMKEHLEQQQQQNRGHRR